MRAGTELQRARELAGLSAEQISERTKIQLYKIEALERGDYARLPQGIYLDGIVRAYAHEVGIDPEPMVERVRLERGKLPGDWEIPFAAPIDLHGASEPHADPLESFSAESDAAAVPIARQTDDVPHISPVPERQRPSRAGVAVPLLALLAAAGWGAYLYETTRAPERHATDAATPAPRNDPPVPFSENALPGDSEPRQSSEAKAITGPRNTAPAASPPPPHATAEDTLRTALRNPAVDPPAKPTSPARPEGVDADGAIPNVAGSWRLATHVESTSYARFAGLQLGYDLKLEQRGDRVTGTGRKVTENGAGLGRRAQTPVTVTGTIDGGRLTLNFVERGTRRPTQGKFVLLVDEGGMLKGRFSSNAARSSGRVEAHRVTAQ